MDDTPRDPWTWWRGALASPSSIGSGALAIHEDEPQIGYYRVRTKAGQWQPVAIWRDEAGGLVAERNGEPVPADNINALWLWACRQPIPYQVFKRARDGDGFDDEPPPPGHNLPDDADPHERLTVEWLGEKEAAEEILSKPIADQAAADRAAIWSRDRLPSIAKRAEAQYKIEVDPSSKEVARIRERWRDLREAPADLAKAIKRHLRDFQIEQDRLERERVRQAQIEADRLAREAREAAKADEPDAGEKVAEAQEAKRQAEYQRPQAGRTGARTSLRTYRYGVITDLSAFLADETVKASPEIQDAAEKLANRLARGRIAVPGMEIEKEQRVV